MTRPKIVVVDDSPTILQWVRLTLREKAEVATVDDPVQAAKVIYCEQPDLVLLDVQMPVLQGDALMQLARESSATSCVILYSSLPKDELARRCAACGADGFIVKSSNKTRFVSEIDRLLAGVSDASKIREAPLTAEPAGVPIVVVAGSNAILQRVRRMLPERRFLLRDGSTIETVLATLGMERVSLVVVGPDLPDGSAAKLVRSIRKNLRLRSVSILFVGDADQDIRAEQMVAAGANAYLLQPIDEKDLHGIVGKLTNIMMRRTSRIVVRITVTMTADKQLHIGFTRNVSATGMLLDSSCSPDVGSEITLRFFVPGHNREVIAPARVVRIASCEPHETVFAVEYTALEDVDREAIDAFANGRS